MPLRDHIAMTVGVLSLPPAAVNLSAVFPGKFQAGSAMAMDFS
jgi:hypothetical protein